ncbi:MAG: protoporphyrinogen oxidase, partial [Planctomycetes bacterium]|nr:protoporphyrinogen oxidase [Planctomycetota bacterium]
AMMHGIYAGDAHALEVSAVLPLATELEHEHGSLLRGMGARAHDRRARGAPRRPAVCTFASGMQRPIDVLADRLGDRLRCGTRAHTIVRRGGDYVVGCDGAELRAREVCVTATPHHAARMLLALDRQLADMLGEVPAASVASTYLGFDRDALPTPADGFGFLAPQRALGPVLGAIFVSSVFPHSAPDGKVLFRVMSGGVAHPHEVDRDDDDLVQQASQVLHDQLGARHAPSFRFVARARHAIPQYVRGHSARLDALAAKLPSHPGLHLRGAGYRKVSVTGQWSMEGSRP